MITTYKEHNQNYNHCQDAFFSAIKPDKKKTQAICVATLGKLSPLLLKVENVGIEQEIGSNPRKAIRVICPIIPIFFLYKADGRTSKKWRVQ